MEEEKRLESDKKENALAKAKHEERMSQERELLDQQMKFHKAVEASQQEKNTKKIVSTKLPKLTITRFDGSYENWLPFINKFEVEIDKRICRLLQNSPILKSYWSPRSGQTLTDYR